MKDSELEKKRVAEELVKIKLLSIKRPFFFGFELKKHQNGVEIMPDHVAYEIYPEGSFDSTSLDVNELNVEVAKL